MKPIILKQPLRVFSEPTRTVIRTAMRVFLILLLTANLLSNVACVGNRRSNVAKLSIDLADRLITAPVVPNPETPSVKQRVYVDSSLSMQGFVGDSSTNGRTTFDEFIDAMPGVMPGCEVFRYGQPAGEEHQPERLADITTRVQFDSQLHDRSFYKLKFNPDDILTSNLIINQQPELSILVTDGVESDSKGQVNTAVVDSIRSWMNGDRIFAILILKSRFSGAFYSERQRRTLVDSVNVEARPFYAFVFSPSRREFEDLQEKLKRRFPEMKAFVFSDDAIVCRTEMPEIDASYDQESPPDKPYYWQMLATEKLRQDTQNEVVYKFSYEIKPTYPAGLLGIRLTSKLHRWDGSQGQFQPNGSISSSQINVESGNITDSPGSKTQTFTLRPHQLFQEDAQSDYRFYSIEQSVYLKEAAGELSELTTTDDSTPASAGKTYRFQELLYALMDVHLKDHLVPRMSPRLYITVANR